MQHDDSASPGTHSMETNQQRQQQESLLKKAAQQQLARYTRLFDSVPAAYFFISRDLTVLDLNQTALSLTGGLKQQFIRQPFTSFLLPASQTVFTDFIQKVFDSTNAASCEVEMPGPAEQPILVRIEANPGGEECMLAVADISEQRPPATITLKSDEKYKMLIEQAYDGVLIYNQEGVLLQWNEKAQNFLGYTHEEFKELRLSDLFFREELVIRPLSFKKLRDGVAVLDHRKLKKKDGTGIEMEINSKMLSDGSVIVFGRDITERKKAEEERARLSNTLQKSLDEIFMFDAVTWLFEYANDGALKNTGYTETELLKLKPWDIVKGTNRQALELLVEPLGKNQKEKIVFETTHSRKDGTCYPVELHIQLIDQEGKKIFLVNARDISERIKAASELKRAYEILDQTNKIARIGSYEVDIKNSFTKWSSVTCDIHELPPGYSPDLQTAINFYKEGPSRDTISELVESAMEKGIPFDTELLLVTAKGNERWVRATGHTEFEGKSCIRLFGTFQDIHSRKLAEEELSAKEKYFRALIEHSSSAIVLFDDKGNFIYQSPVVEKILGYVIDENEDKNLFNFIHPDDTDSFFRQMVELIAMPDITKMGAYRFRHADGHYVWLEGSVTNRLNDKNIGALIANYQDVSERKIVEKNLQLLNEELARQAKALSLSNTELERFAYVASHDLQEPLRMVSSFMKLLEAKYKPQLDETAKQYIHFAVDGAERMKLLIHDLLEYSRVSTNKDSAGHTDMNEIAKEVVSVLTISIAELDAAVQVGPLPVLANTRRTLLFQLIQNLLGNALKYHGAQKPVIKITASDEQSHWLFAVADNGIGINPAFADKIFIIFQRLHNKDEFSGTGIGLSICKKIVEMHGGRIWVESNPGEGSTFYFTLKK